MAMLKMEQANRVIEDHIARVEACKSPESPFEYPSAGPVITSAVDLYREKWPEHGLDQLAIDYGLALAKTIKDRPQHVRTRFYSMLLTFLHKITDDVDCVGFFGADEDADEGDLVFAVRDNDREAHPTCQCAACRRKRGESAINTKEGDPIH